MSARLKHLPVLLAALALIGAAAPSDGEALRTAADQVTARARDAGEKNTDMPRLRNPADAALLRAAFDRDAIRRLPLDLATLVPVCTALADATQALIAWAQKVPAGTSPQAQGQRLLGVQDELIMASVAAELCSKRGFRAAAPFVEKLAPEERDASRRAGLKQMQAGEVQVLTGLLYMQSDPGLSNANRAMVLAGALEDIDAVASALPPATRASFRAKALEFAAKADPVSRASIERLARAFERTDCGTLCRFAQEQ